MLTAAVIAVALGHAGPEADRIARAIDAACPDQACILDAAIYAEHESGWRIEPVAYSWDARAHRSCGPLQVRCLGDSVESQVRRWTLLRAWSLEHCGDMSAVASGACGRAARLVQARAWESSAWAYVLGWQGMP